MTRISRKYLTPVAMHRMQEAMTVEPRSLDALVDVSCLSKPVVTKYVRSLQDAKLVHVGGWDRDVRGYPTIELYKWGQGVDVPCPKKYTNDAERMRLARAEKKAGV